ncbi:hypothetical protein EMCRGX_G028891 [Ephydatia muelleri]
MEDTSPSAVVSPLEKVVAGKWNKQIQLPDLEELLSNEEFLRDMLVTVNENTLLHETAVGVSSAEMVPMVLQAYINANQLAQAMRCKNGAGCNALQVASECGMYDVIVPMFNAYMKHCPDVITELHSDGRSIVHFACNDINQDSAVLKFLLSQEVCLPLLLVADHRGNIPLDVGKKRVRDGELAVSMAERSAEMSASKATNAFHRQMIIKQNTERQKKQLENARNVYALLEPLTSAAKLAEGQKRAADIEKRRLEDKGEKIRGELAEVVERGAMDELVDKYLLSGDQETQKLTVVLLDRMDVPLPPLTPQLLALVEGWVGLKEDEPFLLPALRLVLKFSKAAENVRALLSSKTLVDTCAPTLLSSLLLDVRTVCVSIVYNLAASKPEDYPTPEGWIQPLLLLKHFSCGDVVKDMATQSLHLLGVTNNQPDPGTWSVREVSFWMEYHTKLQKSLEYRQMFSEAGISGLHLLELSPAEMAGLGVKYISDQKKLSSLIDDLRRMNMRHIVGSKDIFLSYAHINIQFARKLKIALNDALYTVWIDEAGIRAGHKWRNEIADGIHGCKAVVFIMTPRSANSEYCQDELGLAEEYHKPIITAKLENVSEMDPGLKLVIQRRQWIDLSDADKLTEKGAELITAITATVGAGSGPERENEPSSGLISHSPPEQVSTVETSAHVETPPMTPTTEATPTLVPSVPNTAMVIPEVVKKELDQLREELAKVWEYVRNLETKIGQVELRSPPRVGKVREYVEKLEAGQSEARISPVRHKRGN